MAESIYNPITGKTTYIDSATGFVTGQSSTPPPNTPQPNALAVTAPANNPSTPGTTGTAAVGDTSKVATYTPGTLAAPTPIAAALAGYKGYTASTYNPTTYTAEGYTGKGYDAAQYRAKLYDAAKANVNRDTDTVQGQLSGLINVNNPLMQRAAQQARAQANRRGLLNSTMAAEAGQAAVMDRALPIASADAQTYANFNLRNTDAENAARQWNTGQENTASQWNAGATNTSRAFTADAENTANRFNTGERNTAARFGADAQNQAGQFNAGAQNAASAFEASAYNSNQQFNAGAQNATNQFNANRGDTFTMANFDASNQANRFNTQSQNDMANANANRQNATTLADKQIAATAANLDKQLASTASIADKQFQNSIQLAGINADTNAKNNLANLGNTLFAGGQEILTSDKYNDDPSGVYYEGKELTNRELAYLNYTTMASNHIQATGSIFSIKGMSSLFPGAVTNDIDTTDPMSSLNNRFKGDWMSSAKALVESNASDEVIAGEISKHGLSATDVAAIYSAAGKPMTVNQARQRFNMGSGRPLSQAEMLTSIDSRIKTGFSNEATGVINSMDDATIASEVRKYNISAQELVSLFRNAGKSLTIEEARKRFGAP